MGYRWEGHLSRDMDRGLVFFQTCVEPKLSRELERRPNDLGPLFSPNKDHDVITNPNGTKMVKVTKQHSIH